MWLSEALNQLAQKGNTQSLSLGPQVSPGEGVALPWAVLSKAFGKQGLGSGVRRVERGWRGARKDGVGGEDETPGI